MASAKRKQDEKHVKILRELVSHTSNKECFDCRQRGPTYVNMTIGSFVCTSCSGILRGLTPPHRVKSISMASFTHEEIEFIKERGNNDCAKIWLGLVDSSLAKMLDSKDEHEMKRLMSAKYEHKRWYLEPSVSQQQQQRRSTAVDSNDIPNDSSTNSSTATTTTTTTTTTSNNGSGGIPRVPQPSSRATLPAPTSHKRKNPPAAQPRPIVDSLTTNDFVADFSQLPDPFEQQATILQQPSFANFDNNPVFDSDPSFNNATTDRSFGSHNRDNGIDIPPPSEDRYAALKDLDSLMKRTQLKEETASSSWMTTNNSNAPATNSIWPCNDQTSNPFASGHLWTTNNNNNNNSSSSSSSSNNNINNNKNNNNNTQESPRVFNSVNPFAAGAPSPPVNDERQWIRGIGSSGGTDSDLSGRSASSSKMWQQPNVNHANPFIVGTNTGFANATRNSNNPFL